jgi:hypothetical protein
MGYTIHPIGYPEWVAANPSGSFRKFADYMHQQAKKYLLEDGYHAEMLFFMPIDGNGQLVMWEGEDRDDVAQWVRDYINKHYIFGLVHVCESWVRFADNPNDHTFKQIQAGEMKVSDMKPEHRKEALSVTAQARDGYSVSWIDEMIRGGEKGKGGKNDRGTMKLGKCHEVHDIEGRFGKLFG